MGEPDILTKLSKKLQTVPSSEEDIVYILSRIRKFLEIKNHPAKYSILNFYCNFALHTKIDKIIPKELGQELKRVHDNLEYNHPFLGYPKLHEQMVEFMREYSLPNFYTHPDFKGREFTEILNSIYSDTPVIVSFVTQYKAVVNKDGSITGSILKGDES